MGYLMGDAPLMQRLALYHAYTVVSVSSISQKACMAALDWDITDMLQTYRHRRDYIYQRLQRLGLDVICPEGAFYIFPSIAKYGMDSETFCTRMVQEGKLAGVPGSCFGQDGFVRFSYCYSEEEIAEGMDRLERFLKTLEK